MSTHARATIGGSAFTPAAYPLVPHADLVVARRWTGRVVACTLVAIEAPPAQHTTLVIEPD